MGPLGADLVEHFKNELVLLANPVSSDDVWIEDVVPSLAALTAQATRQVLSNGNPVLCSQLLHSLHQDFIFVGRPLTTRGRRCWCHDVNLGIWIKTIIRLISLCFLQLFKPKPPIEAPDLSFVRHEFAQSVPGVLAKPANQFSQILVLVIENKVIQINILIN